jgi:hypothetical protein
VVNIPAGTWYVTALSTYTLSAPGKMVIRGASASTSDLIFTAGTGCTGGLTTGICFKDTLGLYNCSQQVIPSGNAAPCLGGGSGSGANMCNWTAGYSQGTTSITLSGCGSAPPVNQTIILDQANDTSDTSGVYICDTNIANCGYESSSGGNNNGRFFSGATRSQQQVAYVTAVSGSGSGPYTVTISPGVYFTNIRSGQAPGAWWPGFVQNLGVENITLDGSNLSGGATVGFYDCYQCWVKGVRSLNAGRNHVMPYQSGFDVVRDSYFYQSQSHASQSYVVEDEEASGILVENNIFQQVTNPTMFGQCSGCVTDYNFSVNNPYTGADSWMAGSYSVHNAGNEMNLFEGNNFNGIWADDAWGSSDQATYFRNMLIGWQACSWNTGGGVTCSPTGESNATFPVMMRANDRVFNMVGNVLGQPGYHTQYQTYATSTTAGTGAASENTSIYTLGWGGTGPVCSSGSVTNCDPLSFSTSMRWGNWDVVNGATQWNATEASPGAVTYVNANFTSSYFTSLAHTLPSSLIYSSAPSWWGSGNWPAIGPDVTAGNVGICASGTYQNSQASSAGQCGSGSLTTSYASHVSAIPAQLCYLNTMNGPPDGSGSVLTFNASSCYSVSSGTPAAPLLLMGKVVKQ